jgi:hypothetical protein
MGRPRGRRQGKRFSIYLRPDRLDRVGWDDPITEIYRLIDKQEPLLVVEESMEDVDEEEADSV